MKTETTTSTPSTTTSSSRLPLKGWALELARRWNGGTYSLFILHGNIFDLFPVQDDGRLSYVPLKTFLVRRLFPERACLLFYDISDGLTFGSADMQKRFFEWLEIYDSVENTNYHASGPRGTCCTWRLCSAASSCASPKRRRNGGESRW